MATKQAAKKATKKKPATTHVAKAHEHEPPWEHDNPKGHGESQPLSPQAKATAKRRAKAAGQPYPNLVDNMRAAQESKK